jgi:hypothetical protein
MTPPAYPPFPVGARRSVAVMAPLPRVLPLTAAERTRARVARALARLARGGRA